ncbi:hypothetical protein AOQ84DRAFT_375286 [Glonium stellatum]|uniref:Uncharacterized protein n=1 Tax=Glonium stellatum TaxID=574774 RepID=A0A8E2JUD3_9PEZI|nr:hypothetical protein AOQ84DRAFT_375286 [Glonium stellatum]
MASSIFHWGTVSGPSLGVPRPLRTGLMRVGEVSARGRKAALAGALGEWLDLVMGTGNHSQSGKLTADPISNGALKGACEDPLLSISMLGLTAATTKPGLHKHTGSADYQDNFQTHTGAKEEPRGKTAAKRAAESQLLCVVTAALLLLLDEHIGEQAETARRTLQVATGEPDNAKQTQTQVATTEPDKAKYIQMFRLCEESLHSIPTTNSPPRTTMNHMRMHVRYPAHWRDGVFHCGPMVVAGDTLPKHFRGPGPSLRTGSDLGEDDQQHFRRGVAHHESSRAQVTFTLNGKDARVKAVKGRALKATKNSTTIHHGRNPCTDSLNQRHIDFLLYLSRV